MKIYDHAGKKTAVINVFVDPENGFSRPGIPDAQGGSLYVPAGEEILPRMAEMIAKSRGAVFVIGQDYHPRNHISFMVNHPGVMEDRVKKFKAFLAENGQPVPDDAAALELQAQQPVHFFDGFDRPPALFPFAEIVLDEEGNIMGLKENDGRIREVKVETTSGLDPVPSDRGRVTKVLDEYLPRTFDEYSANGRLIHTQTLWTMHCVQGTPSCLYPPEMNLPQGLQKKLDDDLAQMVIYHHDAATDNEFYVIRKGANPELDSYGIGVENDGETHTKAWEVFEALSVKAKRLGCTHVEINGGGLATNFCTEFSLNNTADFLAGYFKMKGLSVNIHYMPEISRGIPIPGDADTPFSLEGAPKRMAEKRHIGQTTIDKVLAITALKAGGSSLAKQFPFPGKR